MQSKDEIKRQLHEIAAGTHAMSGTSADYSAWLRLAHKYNQRYMDHTGRPERPVLVRGWNFAAGTFEVVIAEHERLRHGNANPKSVRGRLEQLYVGESAEFSASDHNAASIMSTAYGFGPGMFRVNQRLGRVVVTRLSDEVGRAVTARERLFERMRSYIRPFDAGVSVNTARIYVSQYNRINGAKFLVRAANGGAEVYMAQPMADMTADGLFLAEIAARAAAGERASAQEIERFKEIARAVVAQLA